VLLLVVDQDEKAAIVVVERIDDDGGEIETFIWASLKKPLGDDFEWAVTRL
jgi:hypothetical protein